MTFAHPLGEPEPVAGFPQIKPVDRRLYEKQYGFRSEVVQGEAFSAEVPTVFKQKAQNLEAQPVLS